LRHVLAGFDPMGYSCCSSWGQVTRWRVI